MRRLIVALVVLLMVGCFYEPYGGGHFRGPSAERQHERVYEQEREEPGMNMRLDAQTGEVGVGTGRSGIGINLMTGNPGLHLGGGLMMDLGTGDVGLGIGF